MSFLESQIEAVVTPISFKEMLRHIGHEPAQAWHKLPKATLSQLAHDLDLYLTQGSFAIQVCANVSSPDTFNREIRALQDAQQQFPQAKAQLVVLSPLPNGLNWPTGIELTPAAAWLLNDPTEHLS